MRARTFRGSFRPPPSPQHNLFSLFRPNENYKRFAVNTITAINFSHRINSGGWWRAYMEKYHNWMAQRGWKIGEGVGRCRASTGEPVQMFPRNRISCNETLLRAEYFLDRFVCVIIETLWKRYGNSNAEKRFFRGWVASRVRQTRAKICEESWAYLRWSHDDTRQTVLKPFRKPVSSIYI